MSDSNPSTIELRPIDDLDRAIVGLSSRINAATYELLILIRQFDERVGWLRWGFSSCAEWLHWRCDLSMNCAREKVRVAHALKTLPAMSKEFARGRLTYSKVRALTRVAGAANEKELVEFALHSTTKCVEERCRELRCGSTQSTADAERAFARRALTARHDEARGTTTFTIELPNELAALVDKALDAIRDDASASQPEFAGESWQSKQADAFVEVVRSFLAGSTSRSASSDNHLVTVHVDHSALTDGKGRSGLPVESVRRLCCDGPLVTIEEDAEGSPLNVGRKTRAIPTAIMRALHARDGRCRFPGCHHDRFIDAHHVRHWVDGGDTSLDNLLLLCSKHHRLVHEGGFRIEKDHEDRWCFIRPDGVGVPDHGYSAADMTDDDIDEDSGSTANPPRGGLLSVAEKVGVAAAPPG